MIEILGTRESYFVREEDIKSIQHYNNYVSYVYVQGIGRFEIEEQEYQKLKKLLEKDLERNKEIERLKEEYKTTCKQKNKYISTLEESLCIAEERYLKLHSIIKEVREYINTNVNDNINDILEILDKGSDK